MKLNLGFHFHFFCYIDTVLMLTTYCHRCHYQCVLKSYQYTNSKSGNFLILTKQNQPKYSTQFHFHSQFYSQKLILVGYQLN